VDISESRGEFDPESEYQPKGVLTTLRGSYLAAIANAFEARYTGFVCALVYRELTSTTFRIYRDSTYLWYCIITSRNLGLNVF
jgi:hypothetical protein